MKAKRLSSLVYVPRFFRGIHLRRVDPADKPRDVGRKRLARTLRAYPHIRKTCKPTPPLQPGFSLIELLITLSIAILLTGLAAPAINNFIDQTRLITATNALHNALQLARTEAIKRNGRVDVIARDGNWKNGWIIIADNQPIFTHEALHNDIKIDSTFPEKTNPTIAFNGTGRTRTNSFSNTALSGTIRLTLGSNSRSLVVNFLGRIRVFNSHQQKTGDINNE